ncbi:MAG: hypothetical protein LUQ36_07705 [Methanoregula sp.]|nr:hypothetical protein [Methanoregula sp.]
MKPGLRYKQPNNKRLNNESAVANLVEYIMISGVLMGLLVVMLLLVNTNIMEDPANRLSYIAFTDIGNGISTRIVDIYGIAPRDGNITTRFDIPDDIAGRDYFVDIGPGADPVDQDVMVSRGDLETHIALAGVGASRGVAGNTTGKGMNRISYDSAGF